MNTIVAAVEMRAASDPARIAVDTVVDGVCDYARLEKLVASRAAELTPSLIAGRAVADGGDHGLDEVVLDLALMAAGLPHLSLPSFFTPAQEVHALAASGAQALFRDGQVLALADQQVELPEGTARKAMTRPLQVRKKLERPRSADPMIAATAIVLWRLRYRR